MRKQFATSQNYFWKILTTIGLVSIGFQIFTLSTLAYYMVVPLGQRAAEDLASVMTHAAETWHQLAPADRPKFSQRMQSKHGLSLVAPALAIERTSSWLPYLYFLEDSLSRELGREIRLMQSRSAAGEDWFWVDIPVADSHIRFGFPRSRIGVNPPIAFFLLLVIGLMVMFATAAILTRRLTVPVDRLYHAAQAVGKGHWPDPIEEDGPQELMVLTREFNRMSIQVRELLSNRTTLLAGIAHDLRTPLTQIQLALSMLPDEGGDSVLMRSIQDDMDLINRLIGETLSISLELEDEKNVPTDVVQELDHLIQITQTGGVAIDWSPQQAVGCQILHPLAFRRIVNNLLGNALRYGDGKPVSISVSGENNRILVAIMDRGPGIPPDQTEAVFRPFYRLEKSRSSSTGGSGLGLAIVQQLATANQWKVQLLPRSGGGTKALLSIPCVTAKIN